MFMKGVLTGEEALEVTGLHGVCVCVRVSKCVCGHSISNTSLYGILEGQIILSGV